MQQKDVVTTTERRCKTLHEKWQKVVGCNESFDAAAAQQSLRPTFTIGAVHATDRLKTASDDSQLAARS